MPIVADTIAAPGGTCPVTLALPDGDGPWPGVVMYPDAGGRRPTFAEMAATLAGHGFAVLVPDVYYRHGEWAPFEMATVFGDGSERARLMQFMGTLTPEVMAADAGAFFDYLQTRPEVSGTRFGTTGYCMGGKTSLTVAGMLPERVGAALSFHGGGLVTDAPDSPHLRAPAMSAYVYVASATDDRSFTADNAVTLDRALTDGGVDHLIETYPAPHGFAVPDNPPFDPDASARHWEATVRVFGQELAPTP